MSAVRRCALARIRQGIWGTVAVALLIGLAGGAVMAALAGARRTETAAPRLWKRGAVPDVDLSSNAGFTKLDAPKLAAIPQVRQISYIEGYPAALVERGAPLPDTFDLQQTIPVFGTDDRFGRTIGKFNEMPGFKGRLPRPDRDDEVVANLTAARRLNVRPGSVLRVAIGELDQTTFAIVRAEAIDLTVVGIVSLPNEIIGTENEESPVLLSTPAFNEHFAGKALFGDAQIQLRNGERDLLAFEAALHRAFPGVTFIVSPAVRDLAVFGRAVRPYGDALRIFAAVAALTGLLVAAQAILRVNRSDSGDHGALGAMGMTRGQRAAIASARSVIAVLAGTAVAIIVAVLASPLFPLGIARQVELHRGVSVDAAVLAVGGLVMVVALGAVAVVGALVFAARGDRRDRAATTGRPSGVVDRLVQLGASPSSVVGVRFAYQRSADGSGSLVTALVGLVAAIATIGAALTFGADLDRMLHTPARYGWTWDAMIEGLGPFTPDQIDEFVQDKGLSGATSVIRGQMTANGKTVDAYGMKGLKGDAGPVATKGRLPRSPDEVAMGAQTLRDLHRSIGDTVVVVANDEQQTKLTLRIVGQTLLPALSNATALGAEYGAVVPIETLYKVNPDSDGDVEFVLVDVARGTTVDQIRHTYEGARFSVSGPSKPGDIRSYERVKSTPYVLVALLGVLGAGVLVHLLVTSVRGRRRELAILKSIGFSRSQVRATVAWQTAALIVAALVVGIPLGIAGGQRSWDRFVAYLGGNTPAEIPVLPFVLIPVVTIVLGLAVAAFPARAAARTRPAAVLAVE